MKFLKKGETTEERERDEFLKIFHSLVEASLRSSIDTDLKI